MAGRFPTDYKLKSNLWIPASGPAEFNYSDGDAAETRILEVVQGARDKSLFSQELRDAITDWPSLYHLAAGRANLLRPLAGRLAASKVLEVGAGCGALTRYLGELGADVTAIEGSLRRARIARERTNDLTNVMIVCDRAQEFAPSQHYDVILLVGVLEYARISVEDGPDAQDLLLRGLERMLAPDGVVIVAIENQLGLKYFAGAREDHVGRAFAGINDQYSGNSVATFGRGTLLDLLSKAGFGEQVWLFPFPDYKLPVSIISQKCTDEHFSLASALIPSTVNYDPQRPADSLFSLEMAWDVATRNRMIPDLSNSFLVIAGRNKRSVQAAIDENVIAWHYSTSRHPAFVKKTEFLKRENGGVAVVRSKLTTMPTPSVPVQCQMDQEDYIRGVNWWSRLCKIVNTRGWRVTDVTDWAKPWLSLLSATLKSGPEPGHIDYTVAIDGRYIDAVPFNMIMDDDGAYHFIDQEWVLSGKIDPRYLIFRGLRESFLRITSVAEPEHGTPEKLLDLFKVVLDDLGIAVSDIDLRRFFETEDQIQKWVQGQSDKAIDAHAFELIHKRLLPIRGEIDRMVLRADVGRLKSEMADRLSALETALQASATTMARQEAALQASATTIARQEAAWQASATTMARQEAALQASATTMARQEVALQASATAMTRQEVALQANAATIARQEVALQASAATIARQEAELRSSLGAQARELESIKSSITWRSTAVLRKSAKKFPWLARQTLRIARLLWWTVTLQLVSRLRLRQQRRHETQLIASSHLFDTDWYVNQYPDVRDSGIDAASHYVRHGAMEGRNPSPLFDGDWYLADNPDVARAGLNPLVHYLTHGESERRRVRPVEPSDNASRLAEPYVADDHPLMNATTREAALARLEYRPKISILVPVYNQSPQLLDRVVKSVQGQFYPHWELYLSDDGSSNLETHRFLADCTKLDADRIKVFFSPQNQGISAATNAVLELSTGEYISLLDHDDEVTPDALWEVVTALNVDRDLDVLYSDEDKIDGDKATYDHFYKPDWSPAFALGVMYVGHLLTVRRKLAVETGGFEPCFDGVQDFEFMLRLSSRTNRIKHIPKILYHWRNVPGSLARSTSEKHGIGALQIAAVAAHLERLGIDAEVVSHPTIEHRVLLRPRPRKHYPLISILIPTRDQPACLRRCLKSIFEETTYPNFEVLLIDNKTRDPEALSIFREYPVKVIPFDAKFNFSRANNIGAREAKGEHLVLLNNDTEVISRDWLEVLLLHLELPGVAVVGPKLLYPDGSVQHAGVVLGIRGTADHIMRGFPADVDGYFGSLACAREVSAVTGACLMVSREDYIARGGLSEDYAVHYQDVDFCCRFQDEGRRVLFVPHAVLYHHESATRGRKYDQLDRVLLKDVLRHQIKSGDPYYSRHFTLDPTTSYEIRAA